jgi:hypothetical protein
MIGDSVVLFDAPEPIDLSELDMPSKSQATGRKYWESNEKYEERTGLKAPVRKTPEKKSKMRESSDGISEKKVEEIVKKTVSEVFPATQLDPLQVRAYGKRMLSFVQSRDLVVKFFVDELGIDSIQAEHEVDMLMGEIRADFQNYIMNSTEQNIMTLREMEKLALERHDTRSATDIIRTLDQLTNRYLEDHDMLPEKKKKSDEKEIIIEFS